MTLFEAAKVDDLPNPGAVRVEIAGLPIAIARDSSGEIFAIGDVCSHADVSLSEGDVVDCAIECWLHGSSFDLRTGKPLSLPAITPVPTYPVTVENGTVFVDVHDSLEN